MGASEWLGGEKNYNYEEDYAKCWMVKFYWQRKKEHTCVVFALSQTNVFS